jgi:chromate transporter
VSVPATGDTTGRGRAPFQPEFAQEAATWPQLIGLFTKLGLVAFGGPVAHIAMLETEAVRRRRWVDQQHFVDLLAATNLLPGPNSTQMTMHVGYVQKGDRGVVVAGMSFILPAALVTLLVAWAWVAFRTVPLVDAAFRGIRPVVLAIILSALIGLSRTAADSTRARLILLATLGLSLLGVGEPMLLALGAGAGLVVLGSPLEPSPDRSGSLPLRARITAMTRTWSDRSVGRIGLGVGAMAGYAGLLRLARLGVDARLQDGALVGTDSLWVLWWSFLRFGLTLFGSGYLLVAYLRTELVDRLDLLTMSQLLEAIMIGELTPGPLFTTSTAVGYLLAGVTGAAVATVAIFLPSFPLAMLLGRVMPRITGSVRARSIVRGLGAAVLGVMIATSWRIGRQVLVDGMSIALAGGAVLLLRRFRVSPLLLVPLGAGLGLALSLLPG